MHIPSLCQICHRWPSAVICSDCHQAFARPKLRCAHCAIALPGLARDHENGTALCPHCLRHPSVLSECVAAVDYGYPWDGLITNLKFRENPALASHLAGLFAKHAQANHLLQRCDALVPMPLSAQRLQERGFNQAVQLARALVPQKLDVGTLIRIRHTKAQSECTLTDRMKNVRHAFAVEPGRVAQVKARHLLLIDDVMTTGASLTEAAQTLLRAGAVEVSALVVARTPAH